MTFNKSDASSLLLKYWVKSKPDGKEILHPADLERKMNLIHQKFSVTPLSQDYPKFDKINRFFSKYKAQIYELTEFQIEEPYSFIVVGDLHAGGNKIEPFVKIISENYLDSRFILALGDSVSDSQHKIHWKAFLGQMEPILSQLPIIAIPGNHDGYAIKRYNNWRLIFDQDYPEPEKGGFHSIYLKHTCIILLDNYNGSHMYTKISPEQANWFDAELEKASDNSQIKQIFVAMHHPPFSTGEAGCDPQLGPFFEARVNKYPKIKIIFAGHCHLYQRFEVKTEEKKINYIVSGGGGGVLDKWIMKKWTGRPYYWESNGHMQNLKFDLDTPKKHPLRNDLFIKNHHVKSIIKNHFLIVKIAQDQIEIKVRSWDNEEIESFTIS
jgi:predicted phosphodiesterase